MRSEGVRKDTRSMEQEGFNDDDFLVYFLGF